MKILYVATISATMNFFPEHIKMLLEEGHTVEFACNCEQPIATVYQKLGLKVHDIPFTRFPFSKSNFCAYYQLKKIIEEGQYDIVHCHTPNASALCRIACRKERKQGLQVFYTAHGFHFYKGAPILNWLLYYPIEKICAHYTDVLVTINKEDYNLAQKKLKAKQIVFVPGVGVDLRNFPTKIKGEQKELTAEHKDIILLSVGELNANKNHELVIRAIQKIPNVKYLIAGSGRKQEVLHGLITDLNMGDRVQLLGYQKDTVTLYNRADIFVFPSFREGLSLSMMEAMAMGLPIACSHIRGNVDLIDENGGVFFDPNSAFECRQAIARLIKSDRVKMGQYNIEKIKEFSTERVVEAMKELYGAVK